MICDFRFEEILIFCCVIFRSSFFGSTAHIETAVEEKEGMGSTHNLQVEVPDVRKTVSDNSSSLDYDQIFFPLRDNRVRRARKCAELSSSACMEARPAHRVSTQLWPERSLFFRVFKKFCVNK